MTAQEYEFYQGVRQRRVERIERREARRRYEEARKARLDKVGWVACALMGYAFFWLLCFWASM